MRMEMESRDSGEQLREMAEKVFQLLERLKLAELAKNKAMEVRFFLIHCWMRVFGVTHPVIGITSRYTLSAMYKVRFVWVCALAPTPSLGLCLGTYPQHTRTPFNLRPKQWRLAYVADFEQALRHKDQELVAMKQKNSRLIKESTKEGKSRVKVRVCASQQGGTKTQFRHGAANILRKQRCNGSEVAVC